MLVKIIDTYSDKSLFFWVIILLLFKKDNLLALLPHGIVYTSMKHT